MFLDFIISPALHLFSLIFPLSPVFLKLHFHKLLIESELKYIKLLIPQVNLNHLNGLYFVLLIIRIYFTCLVWKTTLTSYSKNTFWALLFLSASLIHRPPTKSRQNLLQFVIFSL